MRKIRGLVLILALLAVFASCKGTPPPAAPPQALTVATEPEAILCQTQSWSALLPHETMICSDPTAPRGSCRVLRAGVDGEILRTGDVYYLDNAEISRNVLEEKVTRQPVTEIIALGCGPQTEQQTKPLVTEETVILPTGEVLRYKKVIHSLATAYCDKGLTATGTQARVGAIAVDPTVIPYGTRMFIMTADGQYIYGLATAEDCGSREHIYGTRIDLHLDTYYECRQFGARECLVFILG